MASTFLSHRAALFATDRAEPLAYGKAAGGGCDAIRYDGAAGEGFRAAVARSTEFEIQGAQLTAAPEKTDVLTDAAGVAWRVISLSRRPETGTWLLGVERNP